MVHFASYPLPMAPFSPLLSWRKTILQAQGNRKRNSVGSTLKMFGFWKVQKVFDVLLVPEFVWEDAPFFRQLDLAVNLPAFFREVGGKRD